MKALEILKEVSLNNKWLEENGFFFGDRKIKESIKELEDLKEKILHLESIETDMIMKENRSCCNCKNIIFTEGGYYCNLPYHNIYVELDFCCNEWQNKQ